MIKDSINFLKKKDKGTVLQNKNLHRTTIGELYLRIRNN